MDPGSTFGGHNVSYGTDVYQGAHGCPDDCDRSSDPQSQRSYDLQGHSQRTNNTASSAQVRGKNRSPLPPDMQAKPEIEMRDFQGKLRVSNWGQNADSRGQWAGEVGNYSDNPNPLYTSEVTGSARS